VFVSVLSYLIRCFVNKVLRFLVMELMAGGDLFDRIGEKKNYNEKDARTLCKKMIESVCFCHENSVVCSKFFQARLNIE
jgi:serine/threonine protein kinase